MVTAAGVWGWVWVASACLVVVVAASVWRRFRACAADELRERAEWHRRSLGAEVRVGQVWADIHRDYEVTSKGAGGIALFVWSRHPDDPGHAVLLEADEWEDLKRGRMLWLARDAE